MKFAGISLIRRNNTQQRAGKWLDTAKAGPAPRARTAGQRRAECKIPMAVGADRMDLVKIPAVVRKAPYVCDAGGPLPILLPGG